MATSPVSLLVLFILTPLTASQHVLPDEITKSYFQSSLPVENPTQSFWLNSPGANPLANAGSTGPLPSDVDVCIIGSGITGVSTAWHLARLQALEGKTLSAVILEARNFCSGATGRNGGHLTPNPFDGFRKRALKYGQEEARKSYLLEEYTAKSIVDIIQEKGLADAVDLVEGGHTTAFFTEREEATAKADWEAAGRPTGVRWVDKEEMKSAHGVPYSGVQFNAHNLWPLKLVTALYNLTQQQYSSNLKLSLHTRTPVTAVIPCTSTGAELYTATHHPRRYTLETSRGNIHCSRVVHATNAYASHLLPNLSSPYQIIPTRGQVLALRLREYGDEQEPYMRMGRGSWDANNGIEYWFPRPSARSHQDVDNDTREIASSRPLIILGGGRDVAPGFGMGIANDSSVDDRVGAKLRRFLGDVFEDVGGVDVVWEWTGIMGFTHSEDPIVGRVPLKAQFPTQEPDIIDASQATFNNEAVVDPSKNGQYIAAGYTGHGMPRAFGCAEVLARMITADIYNHKWVVPDWFPSYYLL